MITTTKLKINLLFIFKILNYNNYNVNGNKLLRNWVFKTRNIFIIIRINKLLIVNKLVWSFKIKIWIIMYRKIRFWKFIWRRNHIFKQINKWNWILDTRKRRGRGTKRLKYFT